MHLITTNNNKKGGYKIGRVLSKLNLEGKLKTKICSKKKRDLNNTKDKYMKV